MGYINVFVSLFDPKPDPQDIRPYRNISGLSGLAGGSSTKRIKRMAATGRAKIALLTFTDIPSEEESGFNDWYNKEHTRDRILELPGFVRGRRFLNMSSGPKYLALYEAEDPYVLQSADYVRMVTNPDPMSRHYILKFQNTIRTVARISGSLGEAEGAAIGVFPFSPSPERENALRHRLLSEAAPFLMQQPGVIACQLIERDDSLSATSQGQHVRQGDRRLDWALLAEATQIEDIRTAAAKGSSLLEGMSKAPLNGPTYLCQLYRVSPS